MKTTEEIIKELKHSYIWEDNETIDVCIENTEIPFSQNLQAFICPKCELAVFSKNINFLNTLSPLVKGMQFVCPKCKQKYFLHNYVNPNLNNK